MHELVPAIAACGVSPIIRIPDFQPWMIKSESGLLKRPNPMQRQSLTLF